MILSSQLIFSDDQAITVTAISTNVIDLGVAGTPYGGKAALHQDIGKGTKIPILIQVTETFATLTSLTIAIETGAAATLATVVISKSILAAALVQGYQFVINVLPNEIDKRYLGIRYTVVGSDASAGKITAGITMGVQTNITGA